MADTHTQQWTQERKSHWLTQAWSEGFLEALRTLDLSGTAGDLQPEVQDPNPVLWAEWREPLWLQFGCDAGEGAFLAIGCTSETAQEITKIITGESDVSDELARETYHELLRQAARSLEANASAGRNQVIRFAIPVPCAPPDEADLGVEFRFRLAATNHLLALVPNAAMLGVLRPPELPESPAEDRSPKAIAAPPEISGGGGASRGGPALSQTAKYNLELLLEVELDLSVSFGETVLPLQDVLKLASGSIVELNRSAADPVDLLVNNSVIARGEVVVVNGNYGVRVTEIVSRKERIRSIF